MVNIGAQKGPGDATRQRSGGDRGSIAQSRGLRLLFVTPCEYSAGEAVTAVHVARNARDRGCDVAFLASPFTAALIEGALPGVTTILTGDRFENRRLLERFEVDRIVFADWAQMFFSSGAALIGEGDYLASLGEKIVALDHLGYAAAPRPLLFGPEKREERMIPPPETAQILLPCPIHDPSDPRRGSAFRYWDPPRLSQQERRALRGQFLQPGEKKLIVHAAPTWAWLYAEGLRSPYYHRLPEFLAQLFAGSDATVVMIRAGLPAARASQGSLSFVTLPAVAAADFEKLIAASDLFVTENAVSVSLGKAVLSCVPSILLANSFEREDYFPWEVFPIFPKSELDLLGIYSRSPSMADSFLRLELFAPESAARARGLLEDDDASLLAAQRAYAARLAVLPEAVDLLQR